MLVYVVYCMGEVVVENVFGGNKCKVYLDFILVVVYIYFEVVMVGMIEE